MPEISSKYDRSRPIRRQMQVGWVIIGYLRQITGYISKTVQDRCIVSVKVEQEIVCALSNGDIPDDLKRPRATPFSAFCTAIHSFITSAPRDFEFGLHAEHSYTYGDSDVISFCIYASWFLPPSCG